MGQEKSLLYRNPYDSYTKQNSISGSSNYSCDKSKKSHNLNLNTPKTSQHKNQELNNHQHHKQHHRHHHHHQQTFFDYGKYRNYQNLSTEQIPNLINSTTTTIHHKTNQSKTTKLLESENSINNPKLNNTSSLRPQSSTSATVYSGSCYCSSISVNSSSITQKSPNNKQKDYLNHHLYIKSYLDILEEDVKAKRNFQKARPGIRNYTPKILTIDDNKKNIKKEPELWI